MAFHLNYHSVAQDLNYHNTDTELTWFLIYGNSFRDLYRSYVSMGWKVFVEDWLMIEHTSSSSERNKDVRASVLE